ncbi:unnamed protein product [Lasius platythorax]|uniref:Secreted protein n=1 Tax=Lasius platythorax TaxID=488582 RepID=A0AAV2NQC9_9HYME
MTLAVFFFFLLRYSIDRNTIVSVVLDTVRSVIDHILSRSRTERKPRGSTLGRAVCLVVRRMKIVSRGNATWFAGHHVARAIARRARRISSLSITFLFFFSLSTNTSTTGDPLPKTLRYTEAVARTRARLSRDGRSFFFCVHATLKNP